MMVLSRCEFKTAHRLHGVLQEAQLWWTTELRACERRCALCTESALVRVSHLMGFDGRLLHDFGCRVARGPQWSLVFFAAGCGGAHCHRDMEPAATSTALRGAGHRWNS